MKLGSSEISGFGWHEKKVSFHAGSFRDCRKISDLVITGCTRRKRVMKFRKETELE